MAPEGEKEGKGSGRWPRAPVPSSESSNGAVGGSRVQLWGLPRPRVQREMRVHGDLGPVIVEVGSVTWTKVSSSAMWGFWIMTSRGSCRGMEGQMKPPHLSAHVSLVTAGHVPKPIQCRGQRGVSCTQGSQTGSGGTSCDPHSMIHPHSGPPEMSAHCP